MNINDRLPFSRVESGQFRPTPSGFAAFSEDELRSLIPGVQGKEVLLISETGRIAWANRAFLDGLGYSEKELHQLPVTDVDRAMTRGTWLSTWSSMRKLRRIISSEIEHKTKNGASLWKRYSSYFVQYQGKQYIISIGDPFIPGAAEALETQPTAAETAAEVPTVQRDAAILATVGDAVIIVNQRGAITEVNAPAIRLFGQLRTDIIGRSCADARWGFSDPGGNPLRLAEHPIMVALVDESPVIDEKIGISTQDGGVQLLDVNVQPLYDSARELRGAVAALRPATMENEPYRNADGASLHSILDGLRRRLLYSATRDEAQRRVCDALAVDGGYALAFFGILRPGDRRVFAETWAGSGADFLLKVKIRVEEGDHGLNPIAACLLNGKITIVSDTQSDPSFGLWKKQAMLAGIASMCCLPLDSGISAKEVLCIGSSAPGMFGQSESENLVQMGGFTSFVLSALNARETCGRISGEAGLLRRQLAAVYDSSDTAVCIFEAAQPFRCVSANAAFNRMLDEPYRTTGAHDFYVSDFLHAAEHRELFDSLADALQTNADTSGEFMVQLPDGEVRPKSWSIETVGNEEGAQYLIYTCRPAAGSGPPAAASELVAKNTPPKRKASPGRKKSGTAECRIEMPTPPKRTRQDKKTVMLFDLGRVTACNPAAAELLGIDADMLERDLPLADLLPESEEFRGGLTEAVAAKGDTHEFDFTNKARKGVIGCSVSIAHREDGVTALTLLLKAR